MSLDCLKAIVRDHALNPTPTGDDVVRYYVEFEELVPGTQIESALRSAVDSGSRVAVIGPSGAGKSSLCEWVLGQANAGLATVRVPVAVELDETVSEPQLFAQHVVRTLSQYALDASLMSVAQRDQALRASNERIARPGIQTATRSGAGLSWLLHADIARDVTAYVESVDQARSTGAILDVLGRLIELIESHELRPLFLIDDSDAWLNIDGVTDRSGLVGAFFGRVLRMLAELPAGLVVAVHEEYLDMGAYRQAEGFIERSIRVPQIADVEGIGRLLRHRIRTVSDDIELSDVFAEEALQELFGYYGGAARRSVRRTIQAAQHSVHLAVESSSEVVSRETAEAAVSDWV
jgi:ABC-type dipeptide/oligopeptide/nickel transport system ATPase subunit